MARTITYNGATRTVGEWAKVLGVSKNSVKDRVTRGWPDEKIITRRYKAGAQRKLNEWQEREVVRRYNLWRDNLPKRIKDTFGISSKALIAIIRRSRQVEARKS